MKQIVTNLMIFILISDIQSSISVLYGLATNETKHSPLGNITHNLVLRSSGPSPTSSTTTQSSVESTTDLRPSHQPKERSDITLDQTAQASSNVPQNHHNHHYPHHNYHQHHPNHQNYPLDPYPSASYASLVASSNLSTSQQLKEFLDRDHHQSSAIGQVNENVVGGTINSLVNQASSSTSGSNRNSDQPTALGYNHKFHLQDSDNGPLNAGLIQNLTASLFPIKQLSNATLSSLSELLNRTRQTTGVNYFSPDHNLGGYLQHQQTSFSSGPSQNNQINSRIHEPHYSIFDYLRPNHYLETASQRYPNQATMSLPFGPSTLQPNYGGLTATSSGPTLMYRNHHSSALPYVQHHDVNNHQHIDKIFYHSTPFRPSIVNPPSHGSSSKPQSVPSIQPAGVIRSAGGLLRHKESEAGGGVSKSNSFASLVSQTNSISDIKSEISQPSGQGSSNNNGNSSKMSGFARHPNLNEPKTTTNLPPLDDFNFDARFNLSNTSVVAFNSSDQDVPHSNKSSPSNPSSLFDLYEREIDNQIREALFASTEHPLLASTRPKPISNHWFERTPPSSLLTSEDSSDTDSFSSASWDRPVALGSQVTRYLPHRPPVGTQLASADHLAAALQALPTFGASDLQPLYPSGATFSLLPHTNHHTDNPYPSDSHSMASIASQFYSVPPPTTSALNTLLDTESITRKPNSNHHQHNNHQSSLGGSSNHHASTISHTGLPSILLRLNSNVLSSILTTPLAQLYASLPKNRNQKKPSNGNVHANNHHHNNHYSQDMQQQSSQTSQSSSPISLFHLHSLGGLTGKGLFGALSSGSAGSSSDNLATAASNQISSNRRPKYQSHAGASNRQHQFQRAAIVAASANLLAATAASTAAEGHQLSPLQAALIQAQAINNIGAYLKANQEHELLATSGSNNLDHHYHHSSTNSASGTAYESGIGGYIPPIIWRNFLSPAHWARKQSITSHSSQIPIHQQVASGLLPSSLLPSFTPHGSHHKSNINSSNNNLSNDINQQNANNNPSSGRHHRLSSLFGSGSLAAHLASPLTSASSNSVLFATTSGTSIGTGTTTRSVHHEQPPKKPKLEIRILKIPVAFFDHPSTPNSTATTIGLLPAPSNLAASILAHIPCTLSHGGATLQPHNLDQHIVSAPLGSTTPVALGSVPASASLTPSKTSQRLFKMASRK